MAQPTTLWKEQIPADEEERFAGHARAFAQAQQVRNQKKGTVRSAASSR